MKVLVELVAVCGGSHEVSELLAIHGMRCEAYIHPWHTL
tara:strand:- start:538 stop:654 length:117 start_codon:yes stop_codon:yes gene_type:complete